MGIKFHCPNGHKLNVKAFLAGKRGICPHCGCKMDIPLVSQRGPDARRQSAGKSETAPAPVPAAATVAVQAKAEPRETPHAAVATVAASAVPSAAAMAPSDPLAESPQALWYVRPTTGGQFGPASGDSLRGWINEGRVNGQSLVWREGWPQWKKADGVFKELAHPVAAPTMSPPTVPAATAAVAPATAAPTAPVAPAGRVAPRGAATPTSPSVSQADEARSMVRRRKSNVPTIVAVLVMTVLLVLLTVFLWFIT